MFEGGIWDYVEEEDKSKEYIIKWVTPKEPGSGKIWSIISPDDLDFQIDVIDVYIKSPSYTKSGKIYTRGTITIIDDEAFIL